MPPIPATNDETPASPIGLSTTHKAAADFTGQTQILDLEQPIIKKELQAGHTLRRDSIVHHIQQHQREVVALHEGLTNVVKSLIAKVAGYVEQLHPRLQFAHNLCSLLLLRMIELKARAPSVSKGFSAMDSDCSP